MLGHSPKSMTHGPSRQLHDWPELERTKHDVTVPASSQAERRVNVTESSQALRPHDVVVLPGHEGARAGQVWACLLYTSRCV